MFEDGREPAADGGRNELPLVAADGQPVRGVVAWAVEMVLLRVRGTAIARIG